jgi:hypothetical protein
MASFRAAFHMVARHPVHGTHRPIAAGRLRGDGEIGDDSRQIYKGERQDRYDGGESSHHGSHLLL